MTRRTAYATFIAFLLLAFLVVPVFSQAVYPENMTMTEVDPILVQVCSCAQIEDHTYMYNPATSSTTVPGWPGYGGSGYTTNPTATLGYPTLEPTAALEPTLLPNPTIQPTRTSESDPTVHPTRTQHSTKTPKPACNNGEGNGGEDCSPSDNGNDDED